MIRKSQIIIACSLLGCLTTCHAFAQQETTPQEENALPELFDDLPKPKTKAANAETTENLGSQQDPFAIIAQKMQRSQNALTQGDSSDKTQKIQEDILLDLDKLLEQAKKQQCSGGNCNKPGSANKPGGNKPGNSAAQGSKPGQGKGTAGQPKVVNEQELASQLKEIWGHLPPKIRESMQNVSLDSFLPKYQTLIEEYYKKLAEQPAKNVP